jgi:hypothetical protein
MMTITNLRFSLPAVFLCSSMFYSSLATAASCFVDYYDEIYLDYCAQQVAPSYCDDALFAGTAMTTYSSGNCTTENLLGYCTIEERMNAPESHYYSDNSPGVTAAELKETCEFEAEGITPGVWTGDAPAPSDGTPVTLNGSVQLADGTPLCAMVLASGQYMFTCDPVGDYSLTGLPREPDGTVNRQIYVDGTYPSVVVLPGSVAETVVMEPAYDCPSYNPPSDPGIFPEAAGKRISISGQVFDRDTETPICTMVLANGAYMFSCDGTGSYSLDFPLDSNGQYQVQVYADGFAPTIQTFDESGTGGDIGMARASECQ